MCHALYTTCYMSWLYAQMRMELRWGQGQTTGLDVREMMRPVILPGLGEAVMFHVLACNPPCDGLTTFTWCSHICGF